MTMPQVTGRGTRLYYEDTGAGPVVLLSHSWWCDGRQWPQVPALVDSGYRVLNLDNRGHGRSGPHRQPFTIWDMADDLIAVLDDAGVDEAIVVGLSIGGMAGIRAAVRYPERVRALVLADTGAAAQGIVNRVKITALSPVWRTPARRLIASQVVNVLFGSTARRDQPDLVGARHLTCRGSRQIGLWMVVRESSSGLILDHALLHQPADGADSRPGITKGLPD
jgi:3-oxoadipate enol-lactonase